MSHQRVLHFLSGNIITKDEVLVGNRGQVFQMQMGTSVISALDVKVMGFRCQPVD